MHHADFRTRELALGIDQIEGFFPKEFIAIQTRRPGGVSEGPFRSLNLGDHVGDEPNRVLHNRQHLQAVMSSPAVWLKQVHGTRVVDLSEPAPRQASQLGQEGEGAIQADASIGQGPVSQRAGASSCLVMTADCLPILVARPLTRQFGAIHAGWRGLAAGVIETTLMAIQSRGGITQPQADDDWWIWLGPCIGPESFEVGDEVRKAFVSLTPDAASAFAPSISSGPSSKWLADLQHLAILRIEEWGRATGCLPKIHLAQDRRCVFHNADQFFSFRREKVCGRMASAIGLRPAS